MNISNIFESIAGWAKNFISKILPSSQKFLKLASGIVNFIKTADTSHPEILNALVAVIPGSFDNYLLDKLRAALPSIVVKMKLVSDEAGKTPDEIFADAVKLIQSMDSEYRATALGSIWIHLANILTDSGVSQSDLQKIQQAWYDEIGKVELLGPDGGIYPNCYSGYDADPVLKRCVKNPL
jgi:hypothetical protein